MSRRIEQIVGKAAELIEERQKYEVARARIAQVCEDVSGICSDCLQSGESSINIKRDVVQGWWPSKVPMFERSWNSQKGTTIKARLGVHDKTSTIIIENEFGNGTELTYLRYFMQPDSIFIRIQKGNSGFMNVPKSETVYKSPDVMEAMDEVEQIIEAFTQHKARPALDYLNG